MGAGIKSDCVMTEWRPIPDWEGIYEVSDTGLVRSLDRVVPRIDGHPRRLKGKHLKPAVINDHLFVALSRSSNPKLWHIGRLVLLAFVGPCPPRTVTCHNNGDPTNNHLSNLRWDTKSANALDTLAHGTNFYANKTHCPHGHRYDTENTLWSRGRSDVRGHRSCRACRDARSLSPDDPRHGTPCGYGTYHCTCEPCRLAFNAKQRENHARRQAKKGIAA